MSENREKRYRAVVALASFADAHVHIVVEFVDNNAINVFLLNPIMLI